MDKKEWKIIRSENKGNIRLFDISYKYLISPRTGQEVEVVCLAGDDAVNIVALTPEQEVLLIHQFRFGILDYTYEVPGGFVDKGESVLTAAKRELQEETGYSAKEWIYLGKVPMNPTFQDAYIHHYLALDAKLTAKTNFDDAEDIAFKLLPISDVEEGLRNLKFQHPHAISALFAALSHLKKL